MDDTFSRAPAAGMTHQGELIDPEGCCALLLFELPGGILRYGSSSLMDLIGISPDELPEGLEGFLSFIHLEDRESCREQLRGVVDSAGHKEVRLQTRMLHTEGYEVPVHLKAKQYCRGKDSLLELYCSKSEGMFWKDAMRHRTLKGTTSAGSWEYCYKSGRCTIDGAAGRLHGISSDTRSCSLKHLLMRLEASEQQRIIDAIEGSQDSCIHLCYRRRDPAGEEVHLLSCGFRSGDILVGCTLDITEVVETKQQVEKDNQRLALLMEITQQPFLSEDAMLKYALKKLAKLLKCSYGYICLFGEASEEIIRDVYYIQGRVGSKLVRPNGQADTQWIKMLARMEKPLVVNKGTPHAVLKMVHAYKHVQLESLVSLTVTDDDTPGVRMLVALGNSRSTFTQGDVREVQLASKYLWQLMLRRRKEQKHREVYEQLLHAQRLDTMGRLVGSVAHDFKNMLTVILGNLDILEYAWSEGQEETHTDCLDEAFQDIRTAADRAAGISRQLLAQSQKHEHKKEMISLADQARNLEGMLERLLDEHTSVHTVIPRDIWPIEADLYQIYQVLLNLFVNARDALTDPGTITLEVRNRWIHGARNKQYVEMAVHDTGSGIDPQQLEHIFDPFFTTKQRQGGSGIGLATVKEIVENHQGHIEVKSLPGRGSTFYVRIPAMVEQMQVPVKEQRDPEPLQEIPYCRVLVAESDRLVRTQLCRMMMLLGCDAASAKDAASAEKLLHHTLPWCDMVIGSPAILHDLEDTLQVKHVPFLVLGEGRGTHVLEKPFRIKECARKIQMVLAGG